MLEKLFITLYASYLNVMPVNLALTSETIQEYEYIPKAPGPVGKDYNRFIFWHTTPEGKKIGFRPINTTTGCHSGCTPVVFHLVLNEEGFTSDFIIEPNQPLRKVYHAPFNEEDYQKLRSILQKIPERFKFVAHPLTLTNPASPFPFQTWPFYEPYVVKDAAYSSFLIYKLALDTKLYLNRHLVKKIDFDADAEYLNFITSLHRCTADSVMPCVEKLGQFILNENLSTEYKTQAVHLLFQVVRKKLFEIKSPNPELVTIILNKLEEFNNKLGFSLQTDLIHFILDIIAYPHSDEFLQQYFNQNHDKTESIIQLKILFDFLSHKIDKLDLSYAKYNSILEKNPLLILRLAEKFLENHRINESLSLAAKIKIDFSGVKLSPNLKTLIKNNPNLYENYSAFHAEIYKEKLTREKLSHGENMQLPDTQIKIIDIATDKSYKKTEIKFSQIIHGKKALFFFSSWCGHCKQTIKHIVSHTHTEIFNQFIFIEVFNDDDLLLDEFLTSTALNSRVQNIYRVAAQNVKFYDEVNLYAVPKVVLTDSNSEVAYFNFTPSIHKYFKKNQFERDLTWVMDSIL